MANNSIKILVIDDLQDNIIILNALIKDAYPEAISLNALNGKTGLDLAVTEDPDVILLDILMPEMDGYEVCEKLKADKILRDIPVVFVTAIKDTKDLLLEQDQNRKEIDLLLVDWENKLSLENKKLLETWESNSKAYQQEYYLFKIRGIKKTIKSTKHKDYIYEIYFWHVSSCDVPKACLSSFYRISFLTSYFVIRKNLETQV